MGASAGFRRAAVVAVASACVAPLVGCGGDDARADVPEAATATTTVTVTTERTVTEVAPPPAPRAVPADAAVLERVEAGMELVHALGARSLAACETPRCTRAVLAGIAGVADPDRRALVPLVRGAEEPCAREVGGRFVRVIDAYARAAESRPGRLGPAMRAASDELRMLGHLRGACADLMGAAPGG